MTTRISVSARNGAVDGVVDQIEVGSGTAVVQLRTGSRPTNLTDAAAGTLLATMDLGDPAFGAGSSGVATAADLPYETTGITDGTIGHFRVLDQDGDPVWDSESVGVGSGELQVNTLTVSTGIAVEVTAWTLTMPAG